jgi:hypothetical protein
LAEKVKKEIHELLEEREVKIGEKLQENKQVI